TPLGDVGISAVDVRDIAEATAIVLTSPGHEGNVYNINGPAPLSGPGAAKIWSEALGKPVTYGGHDMDAFEDAMRENAPAWSAFDIRMMFQGYLERGFVAGDGALETLTALLGHAPRTYEAFVRETAAGWRDARAA
ncbi:MAG: NAD-dependent epimerase/dehydratase family protein, partial [Candidatus Eremiobacteraeota bacterium]|nr:NAD-dependent epimerase/dehydratase family protein [Candidatus Eremiobacteraeota bacterium]